MKNSHIEWTDNTFNPWIGCTRVSPGCLNCYAEARDRRFAKGVHWGKGAPRQRTSISNWKEPLKWNEIAGAEGCADWYDGKKVHRPRVFCASLADWLDDEVPIEWLADLLKLIHDTPNLNWLLLTKRPENFKARIGGVHNTLAARYVENAWEGEHPRNNSFYCWIEAWSECNPPANVWIGTTVEDQARADERIPALLNIPSRIRFLSCEPLIEVVDLLLGNETARLDIHWVICGGESGPGARPMHPDWARSLRDQCQAAGVPFFFKQWGEWIEVPAFQKNGDMLYTDVIGKDRGCVLRKVGKHAAGRILDGRTWDEFPKVEAAT